MAPLRILLPRFDSVPNNHPAISTPALVGFSAIAAAAVGLVVGLVIVYFRRRGAAPATGHHERTVEKQPSLEGKPLSADLRALPPHRAVSRHNITPSLVLPLPAPPVPAAPKQSLQAGPGAPVGAGPLSNVQILTHHTAPSPIPRAFAPVSASVSSPASSPDPSDSPLNAPPVRPSLDRAASPEGAPSSKSAASRPGSVASFSRHSILSASRRGSFLRNSLSSLFSSPGTTPAHHLKVHHLFPPLLPDELVLREGERVVLIQAYGDGWHVVGRRAPWAPKPTPTSGAVQYPFGQAAARRVADDIELGAVPAWVFRKDAGPQERPVRSASLGVTLVPDLQERREDVLAWSNF